MIVCGIASIPAREDDLKRVLDAITPQVNKVYVALNGYDESPQWLEKSIFIEAIFTDNSFGDAMKFHWADKQENCYYITLDDDLIPPKGYVENILAGVDKYNGLVSYHGRTYLPPVTDFRKWAGNYRCLGNVSEDVKVNLVGSGCCAFHTSRLKLSLSDFPLPNMADCYLSRQAKLQGVPMIVLKHPSNYFIYTNPNETIWRNTRYFSAQTEILQSYIK